MRSIDSRLLVLVLLLGLLVPASAVSGDEAQATSEPEARTGSETESDSLPIILAPPEDGAWTLPIRESFQKDALEKEGRRPAFRFEDGRSESGIDFAHRIVEDAGRRYKMVHYDHGNGVSAADVNGDGMVDLYFTNQVGPNELWLNRGDGRFVSGTDRAGVGIEDKIGVAAAFGDADNDGDPDLYITTVRQGNHFFENLGDGRFRDATESSRLGHVGHSSGAIWFDYDRDGLLDLFVTNVGVYTTDEKGAGGYFVGIDPDAFSGHHHPERFERSLLFRNLGENRFEEVSESVGLVDTGWSGDALAYDFDGDGWTDLYVLNMQGDDSLWLNREGKRFEEATERLFPKTSWGAMGVTLLDVDDDGRQDLYITDMHSDMSREVGFEEERDKSKISWTDEHLQGGANNVFGNALYRQTSEGPWEEISDPAGAEVYWPWGVTAADFDADGLEDLFVTASMNFPFRYQPNSLLWNLGGRFVDVAFVTGVEPRPEGTRTHWFVADCLETEAEKTYCEGKEGEHEVHATLGSRSSVAVDLDDDGDLDLVTNEFNSPAQVFVNHLDPGDGVHWLAIELEGTRSNRDGLGAEVTVKTANGSHRRAQTGNSGYLAQSSLPLYFGLGDAERVEEIVIEWPSGTRQVVPGPVEVDRILEVTESSPTPDPEESEEPGDSDEGSEAADEGPDPEG